VPGGEALVAVGRVIHRGATTALAEAELVGAQSGKLFAHATSTCLIR
jgi:acyl-coenzyme A thioesterase PaaI-like protein